jgi:hypothetical protein
MDSGVSVKIPSLTKLQTGKAFEISIQNLPAQGKIGIPALPPHLDEAGLAQLLHVMRYRRRAEDGVLFKMTARHAFSRRHLPQNCEPVRIGKCATDGAKLRVGQRYARLGALRSHIEEMSFAGKRCAQTRSATRV